jgi:hypothetical protein
MQIDSGVRLIASCVFREARFELRVGRRLSETRHDDARDVIGIEPREHPVQRVEAHVAGRTTASRGHITHRALHLPVSSRFTVTPIALHF